MGSLSKKEKKLQTTKKIVEAASIEFSEKGFAGARMDEIAKLSGFNKATIYYNIGDKEALYERIIQDSIQIISDTFRQLSSSGEPPEEKLKKYIFSVAKMLDENDRLSRIVMWENASGGRSMPDILARTISQMLSFLEELLEEGVNEGIFHKVTPMAVHMLVMGSFLFYKTSHPIRNSKPQFPDSLKQLSSELLNGFSDEVTELVLRSVKR